METNSGRCPLWRFTYPHRGGGPPAGNGGRCGDEGGGGGGGSGGGGGGGSDGGGRAAGGDDSTTAAEGSAESAWDAWVEVIILPPSLLQNEPPGHGLQCRCQLPLALGYARTIHKSQGCTLSGETLNPAGIFADGQAYVALSRPVSDATRGGLGRCVSDACCSPTSRCPLRFSRSRARNATRRKR